MADSAHIVRTLWHGSALSVWEHLSLLSFVKHGHEVEVYSYEKLDVPPGVRWCDARAILPETGAFSYTEGPAKGSFAAFSNLFRIKMLAELGGIWADADLLCLKPMHDLPPSCVGRHQEDYTNGAFLKFAAGDPICLEIYERASALGSAIKLGQMSGLVTEAAFRAGSTCKVLPVPAFYPVPWSDTWLLVDPEQRERCEELASTSYCVHWWNTAITLVMGMPKEALPPVGSFLYEHARSILPASQLQAWPIEVARPWIEGFRRYRPDIEASRLAEIDRLTKEVESLQRDRVALTDMETTLARLKDETSRASVERAHLEHELAQLRGTLAERDALITQLMTSKSWKLTAPLRAVDRLLNGHAR